MNHAVSTARPVARGTVPFLIVFMPVFVALLMHGAFGLEVADGLELKPWNLAVPAVLLAWIGLVASDHTQPLTADSTLCVLALALSTIWVGWSINRSPQLPSAAAVFAVQVLNLGLFVAIAGLVGSGRDLASINRAIFLVGAVVATISLLLYARVLWSFAAGTIHPLQEPLLGAALDRGLALRLVGFAEDPNFYALYMTLPFLAGFSLASGTGKWVGLLLIGASLLLAMSRTFVVAFLGTAILLAAPRLRYRPGRTHEYSRSLRRGLLLCVGLAAALFVFSPEVRTFITARVTSVHQQSRVGLWLRVLDGWDRPVLGEGLRSVDLVVGHFSHNTYLDQLVETGVVGLFLFVVFLIAVTLKGWRTRHVSGATPWFHAWLIVLATGATFSITYSPQLVLIGGVLVALPGRSVPDADARPAAGDGGARAGPGTGGDG